MMKGDLARQQSLGREPDFALANGNGWRAGEPGNQKLNHVSNFRARDLSPRSCNGSGESLSGGQMPQARMGDDRPIMQVGSG